MMMRWLRAHIGRPLGKWEATVGFWAQVTGTSPETQTAGEVWLAPESGEPNLALTGETAASFVSVDLVVDDTASTLATAFGHGATPGGEGETSGRSPGGLAFRLEPTHDRTFEPVPILNHPNGSASSLHQICVDVGPSDWERELAFWSAVAGRESHSGVRAEYAWINGPGIGAWRLLLQRLEDDRETSAHLDFACSDVAAVTQSHVEAGARAGEVYPWWTVMYDPSGYVYCLTARDPVTGMLPN